MPLYEAKCPECDARVEYLRPHARRTETPNCSLCRVPTTPCVSAPAFTPSGWGDSKWAGRYDRGLGVTLRDKSHRERIMKARGLVEDTSYDQRNRLDKSVSDHSDHERTVRRYETNLREANGDKGLAIANTFPADL